MTEFCDLLLVLNVMFTYARELTTLNDSTIGTPIEEGEWISFEWGEGNWLDF